MTDLKRIIDLYKGKEAVSENKEDNIKYEVIPNGKKKDD